MHKIKKEKKYICDYIDKDGKERKRYFDNLYDGCCFTRTLDKRVEKGICGGYTFASLCNK